jgi:hypothetical protein
MSFLKFAFSDNAIVDSFSDENQIKLNPNSEDSKLASEQFKKTVVAAKRALKKSADFLYVRTRAIGSLEKWGPNMNGDGFPMRELESSYQTFVGKGNFLDHKSDDIRMIRGLVIDAYLNRADHCVECLIAVDRKSHPQLARDIETGVVNSVSMGTRVGFSNCSVCNNEARTEKDYCPHIASYKGMKIGMLTNNDRHKMGQWPVHEVNHDLEFIELSWVSVPAFREANVLEKVASLKTAIESHHEDSKDLTQDEKDILTFASSNLSVPESLKDINATAQCKDSECEFDARKSNKQKLQKEAEMEKSAVEMRRIKIVTEEIKLRKTSHDFGAKGKVVIENKDYPWWASSSDKQSWSVFIDEDLCEVFSAKGQGQIIKAIEEMIIKNIDNTDLVVASDGGIFVKKAWPLSGEKDPLLKVQVKEVIKKEHWADEDGIYPKDKDPREEEVETFNETAAEGPSGPNGKPLKKQDETLNHKEKEYKEEIKRAFLSYLKTKKG